MSSDDERDERLGAALRRLPAPEHRAGFWNDLAASVADDDPSVISLDEQRARRRRRAAPLSAAAAVAVVVLAAGALVWTRPAGDDTVGVAGRPEPGASEDRPLMFTGTYDYTAPHAGSRRFDFAVAADGSHRWTAVDGTVDYSYDAATGEAVHVEREYGFGAHISGVPAGGPDRRIPQVAPLGPLADFVVALGRVGDERVSQIDAYGDRTLWLYDGPMVPDRLGVGSPDHAVASVDQVTGVLVAYRLTSAGKPVEELTAVSVEVSDTIDRERFRAEIPDDVQATKTSIGFEARSLDDVGRSVDYDVLVPSDVPEGFELDAAAVNDGEPSPTGPEGMNPATVDIVVLRWRHGFHSFTVTLRPVRSPQAPPGVTEAWDDPFGGEGLVPQAEHVEAPLPDRAPLTGQVVVDPPGRPHLWGITGDVVVTVDGDLDTDALRRVAASLRAR